MVLKMNEAIKLFNEQAVTISKRDSEVFVACDNQEDADNVFNWLTDVGNHDIDHLHLQFLIDYLYGYEIEFEKTFDNLARYLCEKYLYHIDDREFLMLSLGYFMAKTDRMQANIFAAMLNDKLRATWKIVAKENNWDIEI